VTASDLLTSLSKGDNPDPSDIHKLAWHIIMIARLGLSLRLVLGMHVKASSNHVASLPRQACMFEHCIVTDQAA
jgi:hypothetical protein